jgi:hypothetical protein
MTPELLDFLDFLAGVPEDDALWLMPAQLCAERDELEAAFVKRDRDMIRRCLVMAYPEIAMIRGYAKEAGAFAVLLIDALTPRMRRAMVATARRKAGPPHLPKCVRQLAGPR